ncbi:MAG: hypothetical protein IJU60_06860 [Acholeplasmatales bacterium]|nr:hypothetical protein [Acholeplasmatales bacterium]
MDFFDIVPDNFFSLLSSKNKRIYLASLLQVFKVYESASILGIDKKIVVDDLIYFLDNNKSYLYDSEDQEDEEANPTNKRELVNYILRRFEECGWIYVDVTNDYVEILNFTDAAITFCQAILNAYPQVEFADGELPDDFFNPNEYQGYIYSIYSLLKQKDNVDYALTFSLVYSDTRQLVRAIRRLDARMKDYIQSVIDNTEIKDLMEKLITYKNNVYDKSYTRLKISDNIDRYRLDIISRLEEFQTNDVILESIAKNYLHVSKTPEEAVMKANRNIDEIIDAFNALEEFIAEIDNKNRNYINSTIGKIKFLLSEDDNVVGKINRILQYIKQTNKQGKIDKSLRLVEELYNLPSNKMFDMERSLYQPRGSYQRNYNQLLDDIALDFEPNDEFMAQFKNAYNEADIMHFLETHMVDSVFEAKSVINLDCDKDTFMMAVYCIILAVEKNYVIEIKDEKLQTLDFEVKNYIIKKTI